jgi:hypothetical protein
MAFFKRKLPPDKPGETDQTAGEPTPLSPIVTMIIADFALRAGDKLVRRGVERGLLGGKPAPEGRVIRGRTIGETVIGTVLAEVARRSVPGAILVGGGLIAKALRDRRLAREEAAKAALLPGDRDNSA